MLGVEQGDALLRVHRAERRLAQVRARRVPHHLRQVGGAHRAERGGEAAPAHLRAPPVELELLEPVLVEHDAQRPITEGRVDVGLPEVGRLEDVAVGVDGSVEGDGVGVVDRLAGGDSDGHRCGP